MRRAAIGQHATRNASEDADEGVAYRRRQGRERSRRDNERKQRCKLDGAAAAERRPSKGDCER